MYRQIPPFGSVRFNHAVAMSNKISDLSLGKSRYHESIKLNNLSSILLAFVADRDAGWQRKTGKTSKTGKTVQACE